MRHRKPLRRDGFTLVEVLIVVVILGILAATVLPQFVDSSQQANEAATLRNVQAISSQIQLYRFQHRGNFPGQNGQPALATALTTGTNANGSAGTEFGPYITGDFPVNPYDNKNDTTATTQDGNGGWFYNPTTGEFGPNDDRFAAAP